MTSSKPQSFKIIGLGGVGSIVARYLSIFLGSLPRKTTLTLIDGDSFEPKNASRMLFKKTGNKAQLIAEELGPFFTGSKLTIDFIPEHFPRHLRKPDNFKPAFIKERDIVILAVDNHETRQLISRHCNNYKNICLISGGNDAVEEDYLARTERALRYATPAPMPGRNPDYRKYGRRGEEKGLRGTYGNVQIYLRENGVDITPDLEMFHPEIQNTLPNHPEGGGSCVNQYGHNPQVLFTNLQAASAICNALWLHLTGELHYGELCFDIHAGRMRPLKEGVPCRPEPQVEQSS